MLLNTVQRVVVLCAISVIALCGSAHAEKAVATALDTGEATDYLGAWRLSIEVMQRKIDLFLTIEDVGGKVGATLDSERQPEPLAISEIAKAADGGLDMNSELSFGPSFKLNINIALKLENGGLTGRIKDKGGIFDAPIVGTRLTEEEQRELAQRQRAAGTEARANYDGKRIRIAFANLQQGSPDWDAFNKVQDGQIFEFTMSRATKMYTDLDLKFGDVVVKKENVAPDYPGVYSLWLKKVGDGWNLVFNSQPDIWGTRHDAQFDAAEIPLTVSKIDGNAVVTFKMEIAQTPTGGTLRLLWGSTKWEANYTLAS